MTGGLTIILGEVGANFGAGMTGGMAFIYDPAETFPVQANPDTIMWQRVETEYWADVLKVQVQQHVRRTHSKYGLTTAERLGTRVAELLAGRAEGNDRQTRTPGHRRRRSRYEIGWRISRTHGLCKQTCQA